MGESALVTGASGFLGGHVVRDLRAHGYAVTAAGRRAAALPEGATFVGDLDDLARFDLPVDVVVHCAALSSPWGRWSEFEHANVTGTARAFEYARRVGARRFVHVSSPGIYAAPRDRLAIREHEVDPSRPMNHYIRSKLHAEALLRAASARSDRGDRSDRDDRSDRGDRPEVVVLRPRGIIGPGDPALVPRLLRVHERVGVPLMHGGRGLVDLTAVENVALAVRLAAEVPEAAGRAFNITNGDPRPFVELLDQLLTGLGLPLRHRRLPAGVVYGVAGLLEAVCGVLPGRPEPPVTRYTVSTITHSQTLDITRARDVLGYEPTVTLDASLASYATGADRA
ncbi:NAD-dependent epimerase/dehydratase family protein [Curtobacterium pusillum]|uniref:NAD-dependent epimerase/dehydratase family protein n=1 Tax=Curtobacterium pusillum TaxID=69373 RepID=UPI0037F30B31